MFCLIKKIVILILMINSSGNIIKDITGNIMLIPKDK